MRTSREILNTMRTLEIKVERLEAGIVTRYPDSPRAADEFSALRKAVNASASASMMQRQNLISLVNAIDEGVSSQAIRGRLVDLLSTLSMFEVTPDDIGSIPSSQWGAVFEEVGDKANPRSAWLHETDEGMKTVQPGYIRVFPEQPNSNDGLTQRDPLVVESPEATNEVDLDRRDRVAEMETSLEENTEGTKE